MLRLSKAILTLALSAAAVLPVAGRPLRVALVGDPQVNSQAELDYARRSVYRELRERGDLDLVLVLGDLVNEKTELIAPSEASLDSLGCPWLRVNGNHDGPDPVKDTSFVRGGVRFVLLNNIRRTKKGYEGGLNPRQSIWLETLVREAPGSEPFVVCTHIPLAQSKGRDSLANILARRERLLLVSAHLHQVVRRSTDGGVEDLNVGASCGSWWRGVKGPDGIPYGLMNCGAPRGYFLADFAPARKTWYRLDYKCIGRPSDERASARYVPEGLMVNVFGGSVDGALQVRTRQGWQRAAHCYTVASEVRDVISFNYSKPREYRKEHKDEFIPARRLPSPHVWVLYGVTPDDLPSDEVQLRYRDASMRFRTSVIPNQPN
ncbi:MAG: calcineurin-like phosphoesterase C-terminal domain-containing protein [Bacteroidales bacterium]|nr:calcineurin-like phosphoesterase C-terminal domain-containing protein [Bacteroidales bacterium]